MLKIGDIAPDFCLPNQDDVEICLRDLKGKWIVLYFYPKDNTSGCTKEACDFTEELPKFENLNAVVLGVSPDTTKKHRNFIEKHNLKITLLADPDKEVLQKYGVWQLKKMCGRESMGVVRSTYIIDPDGKVAFVWENVKVRKKKKIKGESVEVKHVDEVREKLAELQG